MSLRVPLSTKEFRETYEPGEELPDDIVVCHAEPFAIHDIKGTHEDEERNKRTKTFTISTDSVDREKDRLLANWELNNFNKGGSVLFGHDSRRTPMHVVAAPKATWQEGAALMSRAEFTPQEMNPVGFMVHQLIDFGALRSASVGFLPKEWKIIDDDGRFGFDFERSELLEWSVVPVPANPEAVVSAKAHGINTEPMIELLGRAMDDDVDLVVVERNLLEACWKVLSPTSVAVPQTRAVVVDPDDVDAPDIAAAAAANRAELGDDKTVIRYRKYDLAPKDEKWSARDQVNAADTDTLRLIATWFDSENPDVKSSYKLPHHRAADKNTVWNGVKAAMGALLGARGGVDIPDGDRQGVYNHLAKHYRDFEEEPPEFKGYEADELKEMFPELDKSNLGDAHMTVQLDTADAVKAIEKLVDMVAGLEKRIEKATQRIDSLDTPTQRTPASIEPAVVDLSDPDIQKIIRDEIRSAADTTLRELRGQLPD